MYQREPNNKIALLSSSPWTSNRLWFGNHLLLTWKTSKGNTLEGDGRYDEPLILLTYGFPSLMGSEGKMELECKIVIGSKLMKCVWICLHWVCVVKLFFFPLSTAFVPYCLVVQPLIAFAGEEGPNTRWEFGRYIPYTGRREEPVSLCSHFCCPYMDAQPNRTAVAWSGKPDRAMAPFVSLVLLYVLLLWQESCAGRASDLTDLLGANHIYCVKEQQGACRWHLDPMAVTMGCDWDPGRHRGVHCSCAQLCDGGWGTLALPVTFWSETVRALLALLFSIDDTDNIRTACLRAWYLIYMTETVAFLFQRSCESDSEDLSQRKAPLQRRSSIS